MKRGTTKTENFHSRKVHTQRAESRREASVGEDGEEKKTKTNANKMYTECAQVEAFCLYQHAACNDVLTEHCVSGLFLRSLSSPLLRYLIVCLFKEMFHIFSRIYLHGNFQQNSTWSDLKTFYWPFLISSWAAGRCAPAITRNAKAARDRDRERREQIFVCFYHCNTQDYATHETSTR